MPGMTEFFNRASGHLVDWKRPGNLFLRSNNYSQKVWAERIFVLGSTALAGYWQWYDSQEIKEAGIAATIGFLVSNTLTMTSLIWKRLENKWACDALAAYIKDAIKKEKPFFVKLVGSVIQKILEHADSKSASEVWGERRRLLTNLSNWLSQDVEGLTEILKRADIVSCLTHENIEHINDVGLQIRIKP